MRSIPIQIVWLVWRIYLQAARSLPSTIFSSWLSYFLSVAIVGLFFGKIEPRTQDGVQNTRGVIYMTSAEIVFTVAYSVVYELAGEFELYRRETSFYTPVAYYTANLLGMIPKAVLKAAVFTAVLYWILSPAGSFVAFLGYCLCTGAAAICGTAYGVLYSSWFRDIELATALMVLMDTLFLLAAGVFYNLRSVQGPLQYLKYISVFFYANEALSVLYWQGIDEIECRPDSELPCLATGKEVLAEYGFKPENFWFDVAGMLGLAMIMSFVGYLGTERRRKLNV